jgi:hypothetical protein
LDWKHASLKNAKAGTFLLLPDVDHYLRLDLQRQAAFQLHRPCDLTVAKVFPFQEALQPDG